ncbi:GDSL-type esterase/lipase family protein [Desulfosporosinus sp. PR]|uniref:GDSL-type esterase/lipase family protein n=1 Tax=Candidatus Desulfosporosinus nitrosoreducens TaxID=3401928 RepID=UPI0027EC27AA|nr:GDSL-type esterase/lipase family protein [Desulfosporosinus sp. PR]MDQ7093422.1 GDSL-type esterase/lipase family protein [Desulfosporosinus sp. PR]
MFKKSMWHSILGIAFPGFIVLAIGFYQALGVTTLSNVQPSAKSVMAATAGDTTVSPSHPSNSLQVLILGDSIAKGTGDEKSKGFAGYLKDDLKSTTAKELEMDDAGIDGLESKGLLEQLQDSKLEKLITNSDIILVSIGGNDLKSILTLNSLAQEDAFNTRLDSYLSNLKQVLGIIGKTNPKAEVVFLGLYNPYAKVTDSEDAGFLSTWNYKTQQMIEGYGKGIFIPTSDLMQYNLDRYIAKDGLHPNSAGYQALSNRISDSIETIVAKL